MLGWAEVVEAETGRTVYVRESSRIVSFTRPKGWVSEVEVSKYFSSKDSAGD